MKKSIIVLLLIALVLVSLVPVEAMAMELDEVAGDLQPNSTHCTTSSTVTIIKRKQVLCGKNATFTYYDARMCSNPSLTKDDIKNNNVGNSFYYSPTSGYYTKYTESDSAVYYTSGVTMSQVGNTTGERLNTVKRLLSEHPEGIAIYVDHGSTNHSIVISKYDSANNQFYGYDPNKCFDTNGNLVRESHQVPIERTWLCKQFFAGDIGKMLDSLTPVAANVCIWYVSRVKDDNPISPIPTDPGTPYISISVKSPPSGVLDYGKGYPLQGNILSNYALTMVEGSIQYRSGAIVSGHHYKVENLGRTSYNIKSDGMDSALIIGDLATGDYQFVINVKNSAGTTGTKKFEFSIGPGSERWYRFDVNGWLDGSDAGNIDGYGHFDITIGGTKHTNVTDWCDYYPSGTTYKIENIREDGIHDYLGVYAGNIEGVIDSDKDIKLNFRTNKPGAEIPSVGSNNFYAYIHCANGLYVSEQGDYNVTALPKGDTSVNQVWHFEMRADNWYTITSAKSGKCLYCPPVNGWIDGTNLITGDYNSSFTDQRWALHIVDGAVQIGSGAGFFVIDAGYPVGENYTNVYMLHEDGNNQNQRYSLELAGSAMGSGYGRVIPDGNYVIATVSTTDRTTVNFLDIDGGVYPAASGTNVHIWGPVIGDQILDHDAWTLTYSSDGFYEITQMGTNIALEVENASRECGANVRVATKNGSDGQKWAIKMNGSNGYRIQSKASGFSLDLDNANTTPGTNVQQWTENNSVAQAWIFIPYKPAQPIENGRYILLNKSAEGIELDVSGDSGDIPDGTNVQIWNDKAQSQFNSFDVIKLDNGYYKFIHSASGKSMDVWDLRPDYSTNVQTYMQNGSTAQQWAIVKNGDGFYIISRCNGYALDTDGESKADGVNVIVYPYYGAAKQNWKFVRAENTVSFNANGGSKAPANQTKYYNTVLTLPSGQPTRANASAGNYTVTLNPNGGSVSPTSLTAARTTSYTFKNWNTAANGSGTSYAPGASYTANAAATLYARWNSNTTTAAVTLPTPTRDGYTFQGWATSSTATSGATGNYTPTGNVTLYATWKVNSYYLDLNGRLDGEHRNSLTGFGKVALYINGTLVKDNLEDYYVAWPSGTKYEFRNPVAQSGYKYTGVSSGTLSGTIGTQDVSVSLSFTKLYYLNLNGQLDGASKSNLTGFGKVALYINGSLVKDNLDDYYYAWPSGTKYEFKYPTAQSGYKYNGVSSGSLSGTIGTQDVLTVLSFSTLKKYGIAYNTNGGSGAPGNQIKTENTALTLSGTKPTRANASAGNYIVTLNANGGSVDKTSLSAARTTSYTFKNWNTAADGSGTSYNPGASYTANAAATLYAQWSSNTTTAAVTLPIPTRDGYSFQGWAASASAASGVKDSYTPSGNVTLYAIWKANTYTISYDANGGSGAPEAQTKTHDTALTLSRTKPTHAVKSAGNYTVTLDANGGSVSPTSLTAARMLRWTFLRWNTMLNDSGTKYYPGDNYTVNEDTTLYAQWYVTADPAPVILPTPTRSGYGFLGWATSKSATKGVQGGYMLTGNVTLYAIWAQPDFVLPAALTKIDEEAFAGGAFTFVKLPENAVSIGWHAFADCPNLAYIYIPATVTVIDDEAFGDASALTIIGVSGSTAETFAIEHGFAFQVG